MEDHATPPKPEADSPVKNESPTETMQDDAPEDVSNDYVTGWKLVVVCVAVALACFLMLIDTMIISTVSTLHPHTTLKLTLYLLFPFAGHSTHYR
jgi:hypothetical protein